MAKATRAKVAELDRQVKTLDESVALMQEMLVLLRGARKRVAKAARDGVPSVPTTKIHDQGRVYRNTEKIARRLKKQFALIEAARRAALATARHSRK